MKLVLGWLREFVPVEEEARVLAERLTLAGLEVASITPLGEGLSELRVGRLEAVRPHPSVPQLWCGRVSLGDGPAVEVVAGGPCRRRGEKVAYAPPGARLPSGLVVEQRAIHGVASTGMLCSEAELQLGPAGDEVLVLPRGAQVGRSLDVALGLPDQVLDVAVTPNRGDCLSVLGLAREIAALKGRRLRERRLRVKEGMMDAGEAIGVRVEAPDLCPRYAARVVRDLRPGPAPLQMRMRLFAAGVRPLGNVVDVTNYVMIERGQPLHAFDLARLAGKQIVVRRAGSIARFTTLDGVSRSLAPDDLLICDAAGAVAVAGVMGGANTEVGLQTTAVVLESAHFVPATVRRTSARLGLRTEAAYRFARGVDPDGVEQALDRAAALLIAVAGGSVDRGVVAVGRVAQRGQVPLRASEVSRLLGVEVAPGEARRLMVALGARVEATGRRTFAVTPPSYRFDLEREADLVEEVARLRGYDTIPERLPSASLACPAEDRRRRDARLLRQLLTAQGLWEAIHISLVSQELDTALPGLRERGAGVPLRNPLSREGAVLRRSLLPGLVAAARRNLDRGEPFVGLFEIGNVFEARAEGRPAEFLEVGGVLGGERPPEGLGRESHPIAFADVKGIITNVLVGLRVERNVAWVSAAESSFLHPGQSALLRIGGELVGLAGALHPQLVAKLGIRRGLWLFELDFEKLLHYAPRRVTFQGLPRFPAVVRDVAAIVDDNFRAQDVVDEILAMGEPLVEAVEPFDEYRGSQLPPGCKSLAYSIAYRAADRTLTDAEVNALHERVVARLQARLPLQVRR